MAEAELDQYDQLRLVMGINPKQFFYEAAKKWELIFLLWMMAGSENGTMTTAACDKG